MAGGKRECKENSRKCVLCGGSIALPPYVRANIARPLSGMPLTKKRNFLLFLLAEGHTVGTLLHLRVYLMSANQDAIQRAEIPLGTVVRTLGDGTFDAFICMIVHCSYLLSRSESSMPCFLRSYSEDSPESEKAKKSARYCA